MSNTLAIAAVTVTLRKLIDDKLKLDLPDATCTSNPPDKTANGSNLVNLFLYQTKINGALRNMPMPHQAKSGETGEPPLALDLYYLVTAYASDDDFPDPLSHQLLGRAMSVLNDHPVLSGEDIKAALPASDLSKFDLYDQIERVRITPQPLSLDEMSRLWSIFQTNYRISAAYEVSVVLIESKRGAKTPLPVLTRGTNDEGVNAQANLLSPVPTIVELILPTKTQPSLALGDQFVIRGHHLDGDSLEVRFRSSNPRFSPPLEPTTPLPIVPSQVTTSDLTDVTIQLPDDAAAVANWVAGFFTVSLLVRRNSDPVNKVRLTNELSFSLAPKIVTIDPVSRLISDGDFTLRVTFRPQVRPGQRVSLLFGATEIPLNAGTDLPPSPATATDTLEFPIDNVAQLSPGDYYVRLRVDGVDTMLVLYDQTPPVFDNKKVTLT